jgi:hypothetical protein
VKDLQACTQGALAHINDPDTVSACAKLHACAVHTLCVSTAWQGARPKLANMTCKWFQQVWRETQNALLHALTSSGEVTP